VQQLARDSFDALRDMMSAFGDNR